MSRFKEKVLIPQTIPIKWYLITIIIVIFYVAIKENFPKIQTKIKKTASSKTSQINIKW